MSFESGTRINLHAEASDVDGDALWYLWVFDQNSTCADVENCSGGQSPSTTLNVRPGEATSVFIIQVGVIDPTFLSDSGSVSITVTRPPAPPVINNLTANGQSLSSTLTVSTGTTLKLRAPASDVNGGPLSYQWNFGGGTSCFGCATVASPNVTFAVPYGQTSKTFPISVTVTDDTGLSTSRNATVVATASPPVISSITANGVGVSSAISELTGTTVHFAVQASDPNGGALSYLWDFDGGSGCASCSTSTAPSVTFNLNPHEESRTFNVRLLVTDNSGLQAERTLAVEVRQPDRTAVITTGNYDVPVPSPNSINNAILFYDEFLNGNNIGGAANPFDTISFSNKPAGVYTYKFFEGPRLTCEDIGGIDCPENGIQPVSAGEYHVIVLPKNLVSPPNIVPSSIPFKYPVSIATDVRGRLNVDIPIEVPVGVNGLAPTLSLAYRSPRSGADYLTVPSVVPNRFEFPTVLRHGWSLAGVSFIGRCERNIAEFCLNGEELVLPDNNASQSPTLVTGNVYRPRTTHDARITVKQTGNGQWFEMQQAGITMRFGNTLAGRAKKDGQNVFWYLQEAIDAFGNVMTFEYAKASDSGYRYPTAIHYGGNRVEFFYELRDIERIDGAPATPAPDLELGTILRGNAGRELASRLQSYINSSRPEADPNQFHLAPLTLHTIRTYADNKQVKEYRLRSDYVSGFERLGAFQMCAFNEAGGNPQCVPATTFDWQQDDTPEEATFVPDEELNRYKLGLAAVTDSFGQLTSINYEQNFGTGNDLAWAAQDFQLDFGPSSAPIVDNWRPARIRQQVAGAAAETSVESLVVRVPDSAGFVKRTVFPNGNYLYQGYLPPDTNSGSTKERLIREEIFTGPFGDPGSTLISAREQTWEKLFALNSSVVYNYVKSERNYLLDDAGTRIGGSLTATTVDWDTTQGIVHSLNKTVTSGYGLNGTGESTTIANVEGQMQSILQFNNIMDANRWLIGFPRAEETVHCSNSACTDAQRLRNTNTPIAGRDSFKIASTTLAANLGAGWQDKLTVSNTYDAVGNLTTATTSGADFPTRSQTFGNYIDNRFVGTITSPLSSSVTATTTLNYNRQLGLAKTVTDADNNLTVASSFDNFGRTLNTSGPDGSQSRSTVERCNNACGSVEGVVLISKVTTETFNGFTQTSPKTVAYLDSLGRVIRLEQEGFNPGEMITADTAFDEMGRISKTSLPYSNLSSEPVRWVQNFFDEQNRLISSFRPDGSNTVIDYRQTDSGIIVTTTETAASTNNVTVDKVRSSQQFFNSRGQLTKTIDAFGTVDAVETVYAYDPLGRNTQVQIDNNPKTKVTTTFDFAGNPTQIIDPSTGTTKFVFDALGQLRTQTDGRNVVTSFNYDLAGRITGRIDDVKGVVGAPVTNTFVFDTRKIGQLSSRTSPGFDEQFYYDNLLRLTRTDTSLSVAGLSTRNFSSAITYDAQGRPNTQSFDSGLTVRTRYNAKGFADALIDNATGKVLSQTTETDAFGNVTQTRLGNGLTTNRRFDPLTGLITNINTGNGQIQNQSYNWYSDGTLYQRLERAKTNADETFRYDNLNRLIQATTQAASGARTLTFDHDQLGNLLYQHDTNLVGGHNVENYTYNSEKPHQLVSATVNGVQHSYQYDGVGNLIADNAAGFDNDKTIIFNAFGKPIDIKKGDTNNPAGRDQFQYGPNSARFYKQSINRSGTTPVVDHTYYLYGGAFEVVLPGNGQFQEIQKTALGNVIHIREVTLANSDSRFEYLHTDHLGSTDAITDESGNLISTQQFDPYGLRRGGGFNVLASIAEIPTVDFQNRHSTRGFTGQEQLDGTGLIHMNGRVYDPELGRFISADPFVQFPTISQSYNRYSYVRNNPLSVNDPSGFCEPQAGAGCSRPGNSRGVSDTNGSSNITITLNPFIEGMSAPGKVSLSETSDGFGIALTPRQQAVNSNNAQVEEDQGTNVDNGSDPLIAAIQGLLTFSAQQSVDASIERARESAAVRRLDRFDNASRTQIKIDSRARTPVVIRKLIESNRPSVGPRAGSTGSANVPNANANRAGKILGAAGRPLAVASAFLGVARIALSSDKARTVAQVSFGTLGALAGGVGGALGGGAVGSAVPIIGTGAGAVAGGIAGSAAGGIAGEEFGARLFDAVFR